MNQILTIDGYPEYLREVITIRPLTHLQRSIASMIEAQTNMSREVAIFTTSTDLLKKEIKSLKKDLGEYKRALGNIKIKRLGRKTRKLSFIMGDYLKTTVKHHW